MSLIDFLYYYKKIVKYPNSKLADRFLNKIRRTYPHLYEDVCKVKKQISSENQTKEIVKEIKNIMVSINGGGRRRRPLKTTLRYGDVKQRLKEKVFHRRGYQNSLHMIKLASKEIKETYTSVGGYGTYLIEDTHLMKLRKHYEKYKTLESIHKILKISILNLSNYNDLSEVSPFGFFVTNKPVIRYKKIKDWDLNQEVRWVIYFDIDLPKSINYVIIRVYHLTIPYSKKQFGVQKLIWRQFFSQIKTFYPDLELLILFDPLIEYSKEVKEHLDIFDFTKGNIKTKLKPFGPYNVITRRDKEIFYMDGKNIKNNFEPIKLRDIEEKVFEDTLDIEMSDVKKLEKKEEVIPQFVPTRIPTRIPLDPFLVALTQPKKEKKPQKIYDMKKTPQIHYSFSEEITPEKKKRDSMDTSDDQLTDYTKKAYESSGQEPIDFYGKQQQQQRQQRQQYEQQQRQQYRQRQYRQRQYRQRQYEQQPLIPRASSLFGRPIPSFQRQISTRPTRKQMLGPQFLYNHKIINDVLNGNVKENFKTSNHIEMLLDTFIREYKKNVGYYDPIRTIDFTRENRVIVVTDIHGSLEGLRKIIKRNEDRYNYLKNKYIFLGDYVDRGEYSLACIIAIFLLYINSPNKVVLLIGNHETGSYSLNKKSIYETILAGNENQLKKAGITFYVEIQKYIRTLNVKNYRQTAMELYQNFYNVFEQLHYGIYGIFKFNNIVHKLFFVHGGVPLFCQDINKNYKECDENDRPIPYQIKRKNPPLPPPILHTMTWGDITETNLPFDQSKIRPEIKLEYLKGFLSINKLDLIIRGHQTDGLTTRKPYRLTNIKYENKEMTVVITFHSRHFDYFCYLVISQNLRTIDFYDQSNKVIKSLDF
jgi:hypothetical protein